VIGVVKEYGTKLEKEDVGKWKKFLEL